MEKINSFKLSIWYFKCYIYLSNLIVSYSNVLFAFLRTSTYFCNLIFYDCKSVNVWVNRIEFIDWSDNCFSKDLICSLIFNYFFDLSFLRTCSYTFTDYFDFYSYNIFLLIFCIYSVLFYSSFISFRLID